MARYAVLGASGDTVLGLTGECSEAGLMVMPSSTADPDAENLRRLGVDLVLVGQEAGDATVMAAVRALAGRIPVVLLEEKGVQLTRRAVDAGALCGLPVPVAPDDLSGVLHDAAVERHATVAWRPEEDVASAQRLVAD